MIYHGIQVLRSNLICILISDQDMKIILNVINGIEHPMFEPKKEKEKGGFWVLVQILKRERKYGRFLEWGSITYVTEILQAPVYSD